PAATSAPATAPLPGGRTLLGRNGDLPPDRRLRRNGAGGLAGRGWGGLARGGGLDRLCPSLLGGNGGFRGGMRRVPFVEVLVVVVFFFRFFRGQLHDIVSLRLGGGSLRLRFALGRRQLVA